MGESDHQYDANSAQPRSKSIDLIEEKGRELHLILLYLVAAYSAAFCIVNVLIGQTTQAYITAFIVPSVFFAWLLNKWGYYYLSKVWNALQVNLIIAILALTTGPETFISAFFIPIIIGTLVTLQGRYRTTGYMLSLLSIALMAFTIVTNIRILDVIISNDDSLRVERIANMVGVGIISAMEVIYILRMSNEIQHQLVAQTARLDQRNSQMGAALYTRDKMMSMLSHDLRSPIASIHAGMELFETGTVEPAMQSKLYAQMRIRTGQTLALMDKLLLWSRSQTRSIIFREETISLAQIEQFAKSVCYLFGSEKNIEFNYRFEVPANALLRGDREMIEAILRNLISNAIKFTEQGGSITIAAKDHNNSWLLSVTDTGKGMTRDEVEKIKGSVSFTNAGTEREKGHGLGMQLVQGFILQHRSLLHIDSEPGKGTTFSFDLPKG